MQWTLQLNCSNQSDALRIVGVGWKSHARLLPLGLGVVDCGAGGLRHQLTVARDLWPLDAVRHPQSLTRLHPVQMLDF